MSQEAYRLWSTHPYFDAATHQELAAIAQDPAEIADRFDRVLEFGTAGLRGIIGAGTNRINRYMVRLATQGLADYISSFGPDARNRGVVIAHDPRHYSTEFAREAALTLNANGIVSYTWESLRPTPLLSYAVRELRTIAGVVITASHNPPQYNGYKVYWEDGGQMPPDRAGEVLKRIRAIDDLTRVRPMAEEEARTRNLFRMVPGAVDRAYLDRLAGLLSTPRNHREATRVLYTPLHGTGNLPVRQALAEAGFQVSTVVEQEPPDPDFGTVGYPNPEEPAVFAVAIQQTEIDQPDLVMATDPDADRLGIMARDRNGRYRLLNGNQIGALLVDYILQARTANGTLPRDGAVLKSIASSNLVAPICQKYGVALIETHTGFKFIGDKIREFEQTGSHTFLFGFEESFGYLGAPFVRDKDAVMAALLAADAAAFHKAQGRTLYDALLAIWSEHGWFLDAVHNVTLPGQAGQERIRTMMDGLRQEPPTGFGGLAVAFTDDYATERGYDHLAGRSYPLTLGPANVLHYRFRDGGFVMVRPSGTEPKLKVYFSVVGSSEEEAAERLEVVRHDLLLRMGLL